MLGGVSYSTHHPAKVVGLASCESEDEIFFICHVTTQSKCQGTLWVGSLHPESPPCYVWGPWTLWKWRYNVFYLPHDHMIKVSRDPVGVVHSSWVTTLPSLATMGLVKMKIITFFISCVTTVLKCHVTLRLKSPHLRHHPATFGVHRPYENGDNDNIKISVPIPIPMPKFQYRSLQMATLYYIFHTYNTAFSKDLFKEAK